MSPFVRYQSNSIDREMISPPNKCNPLNSIDTRDTISSMPPLQIKIFTNNGPENVPTATLEKPTNTNMKTLIHLKEIKAESSSEDSSEGNSSPKIKIDLSGISAKKIQSKEEIKLDRKDSLKVQKIDSEN